MKIPDKPPDFRKLIGDLTPEKLNRLFQIMKERDFDSRYLHWNELHFRKPPQDLTLEEWWTALKLRRRGGSRIVPLEDKDGNPFHFGIPDLVVDLLHQIDRGSGTIVQIPEQI